MKLILTALALSLIMVAGLGVHMLVSGSSASSCQPVLVLAVGGCDSEGVCGVVIGNQQNQIKKSKMPYPVAGVAEELCE